MYISMSTYVCLLGDIIHLSHRALSDMLLYPGETRNIRRGVAETNILGETGYNNISDKTPYAIIVLLPYPTINTLGDKWFILPYPTILPQHL